MGEGIRIPYGRQCIEADDLAAVNAALQREFLTTGPLVAGFERALGAAVRAPHVAVCGNGTQALHLAVMALGIGPGDFVIVPTITFLATANAVRYVGAEVVFADVDPHTGLLTVDAALAAAARATGPVKAIISVHLGGLPAAPDQIHDLARTNGWFVIEDSCHALGTQYTDAHDIRRTIGDGSTADLCTFSFHPVKTIAMGEGGAITTANGQIAEEIRKLRSHGMVREPSKFQNGPMAFAASGRANPWYYEMPELGYNFRAPDINCALGMSQLTKLDRFVSRRRELADQYKLSLANIDERIRPICAPSGVEPGWHLFRVLIEFDEFKLDRGGWMDELKKHGIGSQVHYIPVHTQPYYHGRYGAVELEGARQYYDRTLTLPLHPGMSDQDVSTVSSVLSEIARSHG